ERINPELRIFRQRLPGVAWIEDQRGNPGQLGPTLRPVLAAEVPALLRVHAFEVHRAVDLQHATQEPNWVDAVSEVAAHHPFDVLLAIVPIPGVPIRLLPFLP